MKYVMPLEERKRDPFFREEAYAEYLENTEAMFTDPDFAEDRQQIKANAGDLIDARRISFDRVSYLIEDVWMRYSAGDPLDGMRERVRYVLEDLQRHQEAFPDNTFKLWEPDAYYYAMLLMSWAVLFNLPDKLATLDVSISKDPEDGEDIYLCTLFTTLGIKNFPGRKANLLHPDPYGILYDSLRGNKDAQQKATQDYLKRWYKSKAVKGCYWRELHKSNLSAHLGYWAFETGMMTILNSLDDSSYRALNFYPRDMVDYCKEQGWHKEIVERLLAMRGK